MEKFDLIIIGLGPAGISAAIYASRLKLKTLAIGKLPGGLLNEAYLIENYPGFVSIEGQELAKKFLEHLESLEVKVIKWVGILPVAKLL